MTRGAGMRRVVGASDGSQALRRAGLRPTRWSADPGAVFPPHRHHATKHLHVLRGSIGFDGVELGPGEGVVIDSGHEHSAVAGDEGVVCVEAFE